MQEHAYFKENNYFCTKIIFFVQETFHLSAETSVPDPDPGPDSSV
jgi:UDP-N-acetylglucosamine pyrophosphorylase